MLAAACSIRPRETFLDMGCGVGGAGFCVLARVPETRMTGVDIQADMIDLARANVPLNDARGRAEFVNADIRAYRAAAPFDHVICNPPYMDAGAHTPSPHPHKAIANGHIDDEISIRDWVDAALRNLKGRGSLTIIHRADATDDIIMAMDGRFGGIEIIPLWPRVGQAAKRVIIRARKDSRSPAAIYPGIVLHEADGSYTAAADAVLRGGQGI